MKKSVSKRYSDAELNKFKDLILKKISVAETDLKLLKDSYSNASSNGTDDTYSSFKSFEEGSETLSKESNTLLAARQEKFIRDLKNALIRVENKTYGICRETGKLISKKRLMLVPHATLSIQAKTKSK
jgi:DnaK suppressor protein